jgi:DNA-binding LytR/AlgR family response regulator
LIKCIIVEDEELAQDVIQSHLENFRDLELVGVFRNAQEADIALQTLEVDLMFLDIRLPAMSGMSFLKSLSNPPLVVLTTAYPEYALESYEYNVIDYLLKPISLERFTKAVNKIANGRLYSQPVRELAKDPDHIFIKSGSKFFKVNFSEIIFVEGMKDYLRIHSPDYTLVTHQTMNEMEKILPSHQFMRVHKSYIVAIDHIKSIYGNTIELKKSSIPIGISYKESVMRMMKTGG